MNIREIEIFRAVMQEGSVSRAAQRLLISQPAASKYIAQLERRLGLALFARTGSRLIPTPEGRALYDQVDRLFVGLSQVEQFMKDLGGERRGHLTIACLPLLSLTVMPKIVANFMRDRPAVSIALQTRSSARIVEWVSARQVDVGVCFVFPIHRRSPSSRLSTWNCIALFPQGTRWKAAISSRSAIWRAAT